MFGDLSRIQDNASKARDRSSQPRTHRVPRVPVHFALFVLKLCQVPTSAHPSWISEPGGSLRKVSQALRSSLCSQDDSIKTTGRSAGHHHNASLSKRFKSSQDGRTGSVAAGLAAGVEGDALVSCCMHSASGHWPVCVIERANMHLPTFGAAAGAAALAVPASALAGALLTTTEVDSTRLRQRAGYIVQAGIQSGCRAHLRCRGKMARHGPAAAPGAPHPHRAPGCSRRATMACAGRRGRGGFGGSGPNRSGAPPWAQPGEGSPAPYLLLLPPLPRLFPRPPILSGCSTSEPSS